MGITVLREEVVAVVHREDVKAELRKRFGSLDAAQSELGMKSYQLRDLLRGKSAVGLDAVAREFGYKPGCFSIVSGIIPKSGVQNRKAVSA